MSLGNVTIDIMTLDTMTLDTMTLDIMTLDGILSIRSRNSSPAKLVFVVQAKQGDFQLAF